MNGSTAIAVERARQMAPAWGWNGHQSRVMPAEGEGYSPERDKEVNKDAGLLTAGLGYIVTARAQVVTSIDRNGYAGAAEQVELPADYLPEAWPWEPQDFRPSVDPLKNLQKGAALVAAEMDRLADLRGLGWNAREGCREALAAVVAAHVSGAIKLTPELLKTVLGGLTLPKL